MAKKKTWREKLTQAGDLPKIVRCDDAGGFKPRWGLKTGDTFVIPAPIEVDEIMRTVERGKLITVKEIRERLAAKLGTVGACPLTSGIFAWVAANAAEEARADGELDTTPYWRTLKASGELNPKFPGGLEWQKTLLEAEGHTVIKKGNRYWVENYQQALMRD